MIRNTTESWGALAKLFHWITAALLLGQILLGWAAVCWRLSPLKADLYVWHKSLGMLILALVVLRLLNRLAARAPALPPGMPAWERAAAHASHALLYGLMLALPLSGWIVSDAAGVPFRIFWQLPLPAIVAPDRQTAELAAAVHFALGIALVALLVLHIGAALRHHYAKHDDVLARMLPTRTPRI